MNMSAIKALRPGNNYLAGLIAAGARPYRYRRALQRLLQGRSGGPALRMIYRHGFLPVNFNYLSLFYYDYNHADAYAPWQSAENEFAMAQREQGVSLQHASKTAQKNGMPSNSMLAESWQIVVPRDTAAARRNAPLNAQAPSQDDTPAAISPQPEVMSFVLPGVSRAATVKPAVDLEPPDAAGPGPITPPAKTFHDVMAAFLASPVQQEGQAHAQQRAHVLSKREELVAQLQARRLPRSLSLQELVEKLEQANFGASIARKAPIAQDESAIGSPGASQSHVSRLARLLSNRQSSRGAQAQSEVSEMLAPLHMAEWTKQTAGRERRSISAQLDTALRHNQQRSNQAVGASTLPAQNRQREASPAAPMAQAKQSKRVVRVSDAITPAIWQRSYLPHVELRMYR